VAILGPDQREVDGASLALFRQGFGLLLAWETVRFFASGWIDAYYVEPSFFFTYFGFGWVHPLPGVAMHGFFALLGVLGLGLASGRHPRIIAGLLTLGWAYIFLLDQTHYLNHLYMVILVGAVLTAMPSPRDGRMPAWCLWLLRGQVGIVYFFGGIAKLNPDWLQARPMLGWMDAHAGRPLIGPLLAADPTAWVLSWGGLAFDLAIVPLLCWRRTRRPALALAICFQLANAWLFQIGIFPWLMILATTLFLEPDWPRRLTDRLRLPGPPRLQATRWAPRLAILWLAAQCLVPLRHHLYPGDPSWTEEGHRFAWHMKLRSKAVRIRIHATRDGVRREVTLGDHLGKRQIRTMRSRPDMILQLAHHLAATQGPSTQVHADVQASLNGGPWFQLIDPTVDLAGEPRNLGHADWILLPN